MKSCKIISIAKLSKCTSLFSVYVDTCPEMNANQASSDDKLQSTSSSAQELRGTPADSVVNKPPNKEVWMTPNQPIGKVFPLKNVWQKKILKNDLCNRITLLNGLSCTGMKKVHVFSVYHVIMYTHWE